MKALFKKKDTPETLRLYQIDLS